MENSNEIPDQYVLKLYITGASSNSLLAINNIRSICEKYLKGNYSLEVVDIYQQPAMAGKEQIIALPTLVKTSPPPLKKLIGNMSDTGKVLKGLQVEENKKGEIPNEQ